MQQHIRAQQGGQAFGLGKMDALGSVVLHLLLDGGLGILQVCLDGRLGIAGELRDGLGAEAAEAIEIEVQALPVLQHIRQHDGHLGGFRLVQVHAWEGKALLVLRRVGLAVFQQGGPDPHTAHGCQMAHPVIEALRLLERIQLFRHGFQDHGGHLFR